MMALFLYSFLISIHLYFYTHIMSEGQQSIKNEADGRRVSLVSDK